MNIFDTSRYLYIQYRFNRLAMKLFVQVKIPSELGTFRVHKQNYG